MLHAIIYWSCCVLIAALPHHMQLGHCNGAMVQWCLYQSDLMCMLHICNEGAAVKLSHVACMGKHIATVYVVRVFGEA